MNKLGVHIQNGIAAFGQQHVAQRQEPAKVRIGPGIRCPVFLPPPRGHWAVPALMSNALPSRVMGFLMLKLPKAPSVKSRPHTHECAVLPGCISCGWPRPPCARSQSTTAIRATAAGSYCLPRPESASAWAVSEQAAEDSGGGCHPSAGSTKDSSDSCHGTAHVDCGCPVPAAARTAIGSNNNLCQQTSSQ